MKIKYIPCFLIPSLVFFSFFNFYGCGHSYDKKQLDKGELYYDNTISQDKIEKLSSYINQCEIFNSDVHKARITQSDSIYEFSLGCSPQTYNSDQFQSFAELLAMQLSEDVFDHHRVMLHLTDDNFNQKITKSSGQ